jgi:hypothetical protein
MHKYYLKSTNANVESLCQDFSHTKWLQILNLKRHGMKITRTNVLSTICSLNLKHLTNQLINIIGPKKRCQISTRSTFNIFMSEDCVRFLC